MVLNKIKVQDGIVLRDFRRTSSVTLCSRNSVGQHCKKEGHSKEYLLHHPWSVDIPKSHFTTVNRPSTRGNPEKYKIPFARTQLYQKSFFPDATRLWNSMPPNAVNSTSLETFKQEVQKIRLR